MSNVGLEWLHRLATEPQRLWKRYLVDSWLVLGLVLQQKLGTVGGYSPNGQVSFDFGDR